MNDAPDKSRQPPTVTPWSEALAILLVVALSAFVVEALVMLALSALPKIPVLTEALIDAGLLVIFLSPTFYLLIYKPLKQKIDQKQHTELQLKKANSDLRSFNDILHLALTDSPLNEVLQKTLGQLVRIEWLQFENTAGIFIASDQRDRLELVANIGMSEQMLESCSTVDFGRCLCGQCAASAEIIQLDHLDSRHEFTYEGIQDHGHAVFPIKSGELVLGVLNFKLHAGQVLSQAEKSFLVNITNLLSIVILRKQAADKVSASEKRFRDISSTVGDWIWEVDSAGCYTYSSPMCRELLGMEPEELIGKHYFYDFFLPNEKNNLKNAAFAVFAQKSEFKNFVNRNIRKDGRILIMETSATPLLDRNGNLTGYRGADRDITKRVNAEDEMRYARRVAEAADKAKDTFLQSMSHELRTPMNGVIGMLSLIEDQTSSTTLKGYLDMANESANEEMKLIDEILEYTRLESDQIRVNPKSLNFGNWIKELIFDYQARAKEKGIELKLDIADESTLDTFFDPALIDRALRILVENALKFTDSGEISIQTYLDADPESGELFISVSDTGIGFDPSKNELIFERFSQGDSSLARKHGGPGVGLATCKRLIQAMEGTIGAKPKIGGGSVFWIRIPTNYQSPATRAISS